MLGCREDRDTSLGLESSLRFGKLEMVPESLGFKEAGAVEFPDSCTPKCAWKLQKT